VTLGSSAPQVRQHFKQQDLLYLTGEGQWLSGPDLAALTPILHERTCEMLSKSIQLPSNAQDKAHLLISNQRYEFEWADTADIVTHLSVDRSSHRLELRLLGPKSLLINLPDRGIEVEISRATADEIPYLFVPVNGFENRLKISRAGWNNFVPALKADEVTALQSGGRAFILKN
jgi:hypothetical protein